MAYVREAGISLTPPAAFTDPHTVAAAVRARGYRNVYLHLDMDCFDPDEFPDALVLTPGGPSFASVKAMLVELRAAFCVAGCSFVEYVDRGGGSLDVLRDLSAPARGGPTEARGDAVR